VVVVVVVVVVIEKQNVGDSSNRNDGITVHIDLVSWIEL
jgi:hypothetical protein